MTTSSPPIRCGRHSRPSGSRRGWRADRRRFPTPAFREQAQSPIAVPPVPRVCNSRRIGRVEAGYVLREPNRTPEEHRVPSGGRFSRRADRRRPRDHESNPGSLTRTRASEPSSRYADRDCRVPEQVRIGSAGTSQFTDVTAGL
jgi:hypothetical protein